MDLARVQRYLGQERPLDHLTIALGVVHRQTTLIAEIAVPMSPIARLMGQQPVSRLGCPPAGQHQAKPPPLPDATAAAAIIRIAAAATASASAKTRQSSRAGDQYPTSAAELGSRE